jgi:hypothetical protein
MSDAPTSAAPPPSRAARLLSLVRRLIDYGKQCGRALRANQGRPGDSDIAAVLGRIARGLLRAEALEARLVRNAARLDAGCRPRTNASRGASHTGRPETSLPRSEDRPRAGDRSALGVTRQPTPEQIVALVNRQPIGTVIADICRDLGIRPNHPLWPELRQIIMQEGGSFARLAIDIIRDRYFWRPVLSWLAAPTWPAPPRQALAVAGTGPPL